MVFGLSRKEHRVPDLSRYDYYYQNTQDYNRSAQLSAAAASAASGSGRRTASSTQYTPQPQQYHYTQPTYRRAHSLSHAPGDHYQPGGSMRRSASGSVGIRHVAARDSRQQQRSGTSSPKGRSSPQFQQQQQQQPRRPTKKKNPQYRTYSLRSADSDEVQVHTRKPRQTTGATAASSRSNSNSQAAPQPKKKRVVSAQAPVVKKKAAPQRVKRTVSTPVTSNNIQPAGDAPRKLKKASAKPKPKAKATAKRKASVSSQGRLDSITSNSSRQLRRVGTNDSRTNSITTRITKVKDAQGRTQSITKKTIKRIDGYDYIETTTTTTTVQPASELESLDSDQRHFDEFNEDFIADGDFVPIQDIDEEPEDEQLMDDDTDEQVTDDQSMEAIDEYSQGEESLEDIDEREEQVQRTPHTNTIEEGEEESEEEESAVEDYQNDVFDSSRIDNVMLREESDAMPVLEEDEEQEDADDTEISHPSLAPPRSAGGSAQFKPDHETSPPIPDVHILQPSSDEENEELTPQEMLATDSLRKSAETFPETLDDLRKAPEDKPADVVKPVKEFPEAIPKVPDTVSQAIPQEEPVAVDSPQEEDTEYSTYPDEVNEEEFIEEMAEESDDGNAPIVEESEEDDASVQSEDPVEEEPSQDEEIPGAYDYEDDFENPYAESVESTVHNPPAVTSHSSASASASNGFLAKPRKVSHPYASTISDSPQSSNSIFTDALDVVPNDTAKFISHPKSKRRVATNTSIRSSSIDSNTKRMAKQNRLAATPVAHKNGGSITHSKSIKSVNAQKPQPKKPLTEAEMYQKALEIATKKVYSNNVPTTVKKDTKSMMGQRMTLRNESNGMQSKMMNNSYQQKVNTSPEKKHKKGLSLFSFEKHQDGTNEHHLKNPLPTLFKTNSAAKEPEPLQPKTSMETKSTMSDADMYAKALEVAKKKYNDTHYIQSAGIPVVHSNVSANSGFSGGIKSNTSNIITENPGRVNSNDQFSKRTVESGHHLETSSGDQFLRNEPLANTDSIGMRLSVDSRRKAPESNLILKNNNDSLTHLNQMTSIPQTDISFTGTSAVATPGRITTAPEPNQYMTSNIDSHITTVSNNNPVVNPQSATVIPLQKLPTTESAKKKSKFKNFLGKVVQFSTENSGYQLSKDEQNRLDEAKIAQGQQYAEQHKFFNVPQQQVDIAMNHVEPTYQNANVPQKIASQPLGRTESVSSFQRKNTQTSVPEVNGNTAGTVNTTGSSLFSKSKGRSDLSPPQTSTNHNANNDGTNVSSTAPISTSKVVQSASEGTYADQVTPRTVEEEEITPVTVVGNNTATIEKHTVSKPAPMHGPKKKNFFKKLFHRS